MKAVVVVALIALCACAFEMPKLPKMEHKLPKVVRDDPTVQWFTPKDLECAFHVDYKEYKDPDGDYDSKGTIYIGGNHSSMSYKMEYEGVELKYKEIVRADITDGDDVCYIETFSGKYQGEEAYVCTFEWIDPESLVTANYMRYILTMSWPYETVDKDKKWTSDMNCDVYKSETYNVQFCVKDNRIAGFDEYPYRYAFDEYEMSASKDDFSVSSKYDNDYGDCKNEKKIFDDAKPVPESCELKDAAAAVKAVAAVVLAMMALFF